MGLGCTRNFREREREREHVTFPSVRDKASLRRRLDSDERNRIWQIRDGLILKFSQMYY